MAQLEKEIERNQIDELHIFTAYNIKLANMEQGSLSVQLGLLSQTQINKLQEQVPSHQCYFLAELESFTSESVRPKIMLQLRDEYVVQVDPHKKSIICGFKCDYSINFQILRSPSHSKNTLGTAQAIEFIFTLQSERRVKLLADNVETLQNFGMGLQKKYIVHLGFRESFNAVKILGKGVTATVYKAIRFRDQKFVAIKSFKRSVYFANENGKASFQKQFQILSSLNHQNICSLEGVYETSNSTYIVMQNLQISLFGWIQKYGFPSYETGRKMIFQLLKGIQYLHSKGIMHRDLKLQNIMVRKDSKQNIEIVIVDLGLAQHVAAQKFLYTRCGTPGYVAPEILRRRSNEQQNYNEACDVFSVGVIFHILLFKKPVFEGSEVNQVIKKNSECLINLNDYNLENEGVDLLKNLLEKDPKKRISAYEALQHQFFKPESQTLNEFQTEYPIISINNIA